LFNICDKQDLCLFFKEQSLIYFRTGRIGIYKDDDPVVKARNFAVTFQLNEEMEEGLCNLIQAYIDQTMQNQVR
jgi:hypothetical protein